ncbi:MAG: hypothetical protein KDD47_26560 [Acidobacteria bacterium]|nr:hypothetical protein [Acidobacteriota bacterium]
MTSRSRSQTGSRRAFEKDLRSPLSFGPAGAEPPERPRRREYQRLMTVAIRHGFYNASGDACPDFRILPTWATERLMRSLGLLLRSESSGFSVLFDRLKQEDLLSFLRRRAEEEGAWTRLSFVLIADNPFFVNFSEIPVVTNPGVVNFYFSNRQAHEEGGVLQLTPGEKVTAGELLPLVSTQTQVPVPEGTETVEVRGLSGEVVISQQVLGRRRVFLDFSALPEGRYEILWLGAEVMDALPVLYTTFAPAPLAFTDLLFSEPVAGGEGVYPVRGLSGDSPEVVSTLYQLTFEERAVRWIYDVVPNRPPSFYSDLAITTPSGEEPFTDPETVTLADGRQAFRFTSEVTFPLLQQSPYRFELRGERGGGVQEVLVRRLPVASPQGLIPGNPCASEIFVDL